ncbi:MAG: hypothetical protein JNJ54_08380 [Myxococcaceae bacterium]|nr:hypothetical protein [Myxococcaceae bacterium]
MVFRIAVVGFCCLGLIGCKKDKPEGGQAGSAQGSQQGAAGDQPAPPSQAGKKAPEGCNSDLSQRIEVDFTFTEKCSPYTVDGELHVDGWTLTIEPGVEVRFKDQAALHVGYVSVARLLVKGTPEKPVKFTGERKEPGAWKSIQLYERAEQSSLENAVIEFAGGGDLPALYVQAADVSVKGLTVVSVKGTALKAELEKPMKALGGLDLSKAGGDPDALLQLSFATAGLLGEGNVYPEKAVVGLVGNVVRDVKLTAQAAPFRVPGELHVNAPEGKSAALTISAGTTLQLGETAAIYVGYAGPGALKVLGTKERPVVFTRYGDDQQATPWKGFVFYGGARAPELDFAVVEYAGRPDDAALHFADPRGLGKITNCTFRHSAGAGLKIDQPKARFEAFDGNVFEDLAGPALDMPIEFAHALGAGNKLGQAAVLLRDATHRDTTLTALDGPYWLRGEVYVDGETGKTAALTIDPGAKLKALENASLSIGYSGAAKLIAKGTADKPIVFDAVQGSWKGVHNYPAATVELDNVTISGVGDDDSPLVLDADSKGEVKGLTLKGTKKGVKACGSKATISGVKADKGVAAQEKCD